MVGYKEHCVASLTPANAKEVGAFSYYCVTRCRNLLFLDQSLMYGAKR